MTHKEYFVIIEIFGFSGATIILVFLMPTLFALGAEIILMYVSDHGEPDPPTEETIIINYKSAVYPDC